MAFRGVLPEAPSFGTQLARGITGGFSQGAGVAGQLAAQSMLEKSKIAQKQKLFESIENPSQPSFNPEDVKQKFVDGLQQLEQMTGKPLQPEQIDQLWNGFVKTELPKMVGTQSSGQSQAGTAEDYRQKAKKAAIAGEDALSKTYTSQAEIAEKRAMKREEREFLPEKEYIQHAAKSNIEFLDKTKQIESDLPNTEFSLAMIEDSLQNADKWAAAKDFLADRTGFEGFRSASGSQLDSAIKTYFLGDLSSIKGGRPNVFIEKQLRDAYPKAGRDPISNQKVLLGMRMKEKINRLLVDRTAEEEDKFIKKQGFLPPNFEQHVKKSLKNEVEEIEKSSIKTLHALSKIEDKRDQIFAAQLKKGEHLMVSPDGEPFAVKEKEVEMYRSQGYIPLGKK